MACRTLVLVLGDQLDPDAPLVRDLDPERDVVAMAEVMSEVERHWNHRARVALFLSSMRHFAQTLRDRGVRVRYQRLGDADAAPDLVAYAHRVIADEGPERVAWMEPGRWALREALTAAIADHEVVAEQIEDPHFLCTHATFAKWAKGRKSFVMEHFYRVMRRDMDVLVEGGKPVGGRWNLDADNRKSFGRDGPGALPGHVVFEPDAITRAVFEDLETHAPDLPGSLDAFDWPVTPAQAREALDDFIEHRLPSFGDVQDAMWTGEPWLYHARLAPALNLKLLDPRDAVDAAVDAYERGHAPLNAVEGFVRQVIGWREYIRGLYWWQMPDLIGRNHMGADRPLPPLFWTGDTEAACLREVVTQLLETGYAHHIQRLMVTGLFALLYGADPAEVHDWFMALYVDSVEWVTLPNVVGMSQFADGGVLATKPYVASGQYIDRMSNYCSGCRFDPKETTGPDACPFSVLYVDYLARHREALADNHRMGFQLKNLDRRDPETLAAIRARAEEIVAAVAEGTL